MKMICGQLLLLFRLPLRSPFPNAADELGLVGRSTVLSFQANVFPARRGGTAGHGPQLCLLPQPGIANPTYPRPPGL